MPAGSGTASLAAIDRATPMPSTTLTAVRASSLGVVLSALLTGLHLKAAADPQAPLRLQPGLWEMQTRIEGGDAQTAQALAQSRARLAALPPGQRARLEQRLAGPGIELRFGGDTLSARVCITPETAEPGAIATPADSRRCTVLPAERAGNRVRFAALCSAPRSTVETTTTLLGDRSFESISTNTTELDGNTRMTTITQRGRWIGDDCTASADTADH